METKRSSLRSIGKKIQKARREQKLSVKEISKKLRINAQFLKNIEAGEMAFLPEPYVRAFVKNYADFLKLDGQSILNEWPHQEQNPDRGAEQSPDDTKKETVADARSAQPEKRPGNPMQAYRKEIIVGVSLVVVISLIILVSTIPDDSPTIPPVKTNDPGTVAVIPFEDVLEEVNNKQLDSTVILSDEMPSEAQVLNLRIVANDTVWTRVIIDAVDESEAIFRPGDVRSYQALQDFQLQIGNAAGIKLYLNEKELAPVGRAGQVRHIRIDQKGVHPIHRRANSAARKDTIRSRAAAQQDSTIEN